MVHRDLSAIGKHRERLSGHLRGNSKHSVGNRVAVQPRSAPNADNAQPVEFGRIQLAAVAWRQGDHPAAVRSKVALPFCDPRGGSICEGAANISESASRLYHGRPRWALSLERGQRQSVHAEERDWAVPLNVIEERSMPRCLTTTPVPYGDGCMSSGLYERRCRSGGVPGGEVVAAWGPMSTAVCNIQEKSQTR